MNPDPAEPKVGVETSPPGGTATVFLVDDDASFRRSLSRLLRANGHVVREYESAAAFLEGRPADAAGCVVVDLCMPGQGGMELQTILAKSSNPLPVVFLTGQGDIPTSVKAMRQGAEDFLTKLAPMEDLLDAVRRALERNDRECRQRNRLAELRNRFNRLTRRDCEVLAHLLKGALNKQIAAALGIDERSVKRHRRSLMLRLEVTSVAELAQLAAEVGPEQHSLE